MRDPMLDQDFLRKLDEYPHRNIWVKIISLSLNEYPMDEITGLATSGSINIDGTSSVRRTCSLTMVSDNVRINDYFWGLKTKFKVEIGLENFIDKEFPDIIWFKQGTFVISSFSYNVGINSCTISIQGKDKMSYLNGDVGGIIPAEWDFGIINEPVKDNEGKAIYDASGYALVQETQIPIKDIVLELVHEFALEPWQNIIINDLDDYGIELLEYLGDSPLYYIIKDQGSGSNSREVSNMTLNGGMRCNVIVANWDGKKNVEIPGAVMRNKKLSELDSNSLRAESRALGAKNPPVYSYEKLMEELDPSGNVTETENYYRTRIFFDDKTDEVFTVAKITKDNGLNVCGYRICDIVYPYDLIAAPGESATSVLDKLVKMLGNFEYFYDVEGRFIFQKKRTYSDVSYNNIINEHSINPEVWATSSKYSSKYTYIFDRDYLVSSIQSSPNLSNLKNDYSLWGQKTNSNNISHPIHLRYAIDRKPTYYKNFDGDVYFSKPLEFTRTPNRPGLNKNWWHVSEWGVFYAYYNALSQGKDLSKVEDPDGDIFLQYYPTKMFLNYKANSVEPQPFSEIYQNTNIPLVSEQDHNLWNEEFYPYIYPEVLFFDDVNEVCFAHNRCIHFYDDFRIDGMGNKGIYSNYDCYIYDPIIPGFEKSSDIEIGTTIKTYVGLSTDWRELIYQMARDYQKHYHEADFLIKVRDNNINQGISYYPTGYTGYEQYYIDFRRNSLEGVIAYWRELYNPAAINIEGKSITGRYDVHGEFIKDDDIPFYNSNTVYKHGDLCAQVFEGVRHIYKAIQDDVKGIDPISKENNYWVESPGDRVYNSNGWNPDILNNPENLEFWFDFLDSEDSEINKYSVHNVGLRSKATNDDKIKAIYFREIPNVIFDLNEETTQKDNWIKPGYCYMQIPPSFQDFFVISSRGKNCMDVIDDYLYQYTYPATNITINTVPIYYLSPNTLIYISNSESKMVGEFILQKYSIQLGLNSQMSINAVQTAKRIY